MATTAAWGKHTYMLRDALRGCIDHIPPEVMPFDIATNEVWECTRLVMSDSVASHSERAECLSMVMEGVVDIATPQRRARAGVAVAVLRSCGRCGNSASP